MHYSVSYQCSLECDAGTVNVAALSWPSGEQSGDTMWDNGSWWRRGEGGEVKVWTCDNGRWFTHSHYMHWRQKCMSCISHAKAWAVGLHGDVDYYRLSHNLVWICRWASTLIQSIYRSPKWYPPSSTIHLSTFWLSPPYHTITLHLSSHIASVTWSLVVAVARARAYVRANYHRTSSSKDDLRVDEYKKWSGMPDSRWKNIGLGLKIRQPDIEVIDVKKEEVLSVPKCTMHPEHPIIK